MKFYTYITDKHICIYKGATFSAYIIAVFIYSTSLVWGRELDDIWIYNILIGGLAVNFAFILGMYVSAQKIGEKFKHVYWKSWARQRIIWVIIL